MHLITRMLLISYLLGAFVDSLTYCHRGSFYLLPTKGTFVCPLCPPGTFMPFHDHKYTECLDCMKIEYDTLEILISPCNITHDAVIHCREGYYRRYPRNPREKERCEKCGECGIFREILPCRTYEDVHCCADENFEVVPDKNGVPGCVERPWLCRRGEYFDTNSFRCFSCPVGTCMPLDYHSMTDCLKCHSSSRGGLPKHGTIIQPCNKTHQAVVGCKEGFYINHKMGPQSKDIGCSRCKTCSSTGGLYEGRECGRAQDTVCCPQPNMTVIDTSGGPTCQLSIPGVPNNLTTSIPETTICSVDEYLYIEYNEYTVVINNEQRATCKRCPHGTFIDELSHTKTECKNCREFKGHSPPQSCPPEQTLSCRQKDKKTQKDDRLGFTLWAAVSTSVFLILFAALFIIARFCPSAAHKFIELRGKRPNLTQNIHHSKEFRRTCELTTLTSNK